jgi:hypothetical protein
MKYWFFLLFYLTPLKIYLCTFNFQGKVIIYQSLNIKLFFNTIPLANFKKKIDLFIVH